MMHKLFPYYDARAARRLCVWATGVCRKVAPLDLAGLPVYIVAVGEGGPLTRRWATDCHGMTAGGADVLLADEIPNYQGRGPTMVIHDEAMVRWIGDASESQGVDSCRADRTLARYFIAVALHELGHVIDCYTPGTFSEENAEPMRALMLSWLDCTDSEINAARERHRSLVPKWHGHDLDWIRATLHIFHRAAALGVDVAVNDTHLAGEQYGLSPSSSYVAALGTEPEERMGQSLRHVLTTPPPPEFTALWQADTAATEASP